MGLLIWPDCRNTRDLGGLPTASGELLPGRLLDNWVSYVVA